MALADSVPSGRPSSATPLGELRARERRALERKERFHREVRARAEELRALGEGTALAAVHSQNEPSVRQMVRSASQPTQWRCTPYTVAR